MLSKAYQKEGVWYWKSNDSVIDVDICKENGIPCDLQLQQKARDEYVNAFLKSYREQSPDAEQMSEMRAAFGSGATVVNIVTGRRYTL